MMAEMSVNAFVSYQIAWYVFGTIVAFFAAILFWNRGISQVDGKSTLGFGLKLSGAGALFVAVLLVFNLINPLKNVLDTKKIVFLCFDGEKRQNDSNAAEYKLESSKIQDMDVKYDWDSVAVEMIPQQYVYNLSLASDKSFITTDKIPRGKYKIRFTEMKSGKSIVYGGITVP
ncbi:hypothetical protein L0244_30270 [bacterium]|nr:hypothetical protein [bacterium]